MAANVLNSEQAVRMSVFVVQAFIQMRELLSGSRELTAELKKLEEKLTGRLDIHEAAIVDVLQRIMQLLDPRPRRRCPRSRWASTSPSPNRLTRQAALRTKAHFQSKKAPARA